MSAAHEKLTGPRFLETHAAVKIRFTLKHYRAVSEVFPAWALSNSCFPNTASERDDLLVELARAGGDLHAVNI